MDHLGRVGLSEEQADLLEVATNFCREKSPTEKVRSLINDERGYDPDVWAEIGELGWLAIAIPEEYGGVGLSLGEVTPVMEQMGRTMLASPFYSTTLAAQALIHGGTQAQKETWLPRIAGGEAATVALMEKNGAWDFSAPETQAVREGGRLSLSGEKIFVCDANAAAAIIVSVTCDGAPALVLLEREMLGDEALRREVVIDETKRSFAIDLTGVDIPESALMDQDRAREALAHLHLAANLMSASEMIGGTQGVIDYTLEYLKTRKQFGRTIGSFQSLKHPTVDAFVEYEQARSHLYSAAHCFNDQGSGEVATRMAKAAADKAYSFAADRSIQFHGGFGFTYDCDAQLYRRNALWHSAQHGDAAYHKRKLAELLLG
ncbi:MAG: acyl-CoA dehydrogenase family protein [Pseudomonadota bacterium]